MVVVTPAVVWVVLAAAVVVGAEVVEVPFAAVVVAAPVLVVFAEVEVEAEEVRARGLTEFWAAIVVGGRGNVVVEPEEEVEIWEEFP